MDFFKAKENSFEKKRDKIEKNKVFLAKLYVFIGVFSVFGYILNLFRIFATGFDEVTFLLIVRLIGIVIFPIGIFIGYY